MRTAKLLCLAAAAAASLVVSAGVGMAAADTLCSVNTGCPMESIYPGGTTLEVELAPEMISSFAGTEKYPDVVCGISNATIETTAAWAQPLIADVTLSFDECFYEEQACTVDPVGAPLEGELYASVFGDGNGALYLFEAGVEIQCGMTTCIYGPNLKAAFVGGNPAAIMANEIQLWEQPGSAEICEATARWGAAYTITNPAPLFLMLKP